MSINIEITVQEKIDFRPKVIPAKKGKRGIQYIDVPPIDPV